MPTEINGSIPFGSPQFWDLYDRFCTLTSLVKLSEDPAYPPAAQMHAITRAAHLTREIHRLSRPERGWAHHHAWLSLKTAPIQREDGEQSSIVMQAGDVIVVEHGWDRDVIITHSPIPRNIVCGYLLSGRWEPMIGLFLPLFDKETIMSCIRIRIEKNGEEALMLAREESRDWRWY
jgi:hypothetical protein